jgi:hypothetical protein
MGLKFFSDLIEALGKVASGLKSLVNLPRAEREKTRQVLDETYRLLDTTLNMVIIRLGDILPLKADKFLDEAKQLDNYGEWMRAEREFRLCRSLRAAVREMESLPGKVVAALSNNDWQALLQQMKAILASEGEVANYIGKQFEQLATDARVAGQDEQKAQSIRDEIGALRTALIAERKQLIQQELDLYTVV